MTLFHFCQGKTAILVLFTIKYQSCTLGGQDGWVARRAVGYDYPATGSIAHILPWRNLHTSSLIGLAALKVLDEAAHTHVVHEWISCSMHP